MKATLSMMGYYVGKDWATWVSDKKDAACFETPHQAGLFATTFLFKQMAYQLKGNEDLDTIETSIEISEGS